MKIRQPQGYAGSIPAARTIPQHERIALQCRYPLGRLLGRPNLIEHLRR